MTPQTEAIAATLALDGFEARQKVPDSSRRTLYAPPDRLMDLDDQGQVIDILMGDTGYGRHPDGSRTTYEPPAPAAETGMLGVLNYLVRHPDVIHEDGASTFSFTLAHGTHGRFSVHEGVVSSIEYGSGSLRQVFVLRPLDAAPKIEAPKAVVSSPTCNGGVVVASSDCD